MDDTFTHQLALRNLIHFANFVRPLEADCVEIGTYEDDRILKVFDLDKDSNWYLFNAHDGIKTDKMNVKVFQTPLQKDLFLKKQFKYVHLNIDANCNDYLEFFYPKMIRCGVIIIENHFKHPEIKKTVEDFLLNKPEKLLLGGYHQSVIRKL